MLGHGDPARARSDDDVIEGLIFTDSWTFCVCGCLRVFSFDWIFESVSFKGFFRGFTFHWLPPEVPGASVMSRLLLAILFQRQTS